MLSCYRSATILLFAGAAFCQTGGIQGTVRDDSAQPVPRAYITATAQSGSSHSTYTALANAQGQFSFTGLPSAKFSLCTQLPGSPHLNPCQWASAPQVTLAAGQTLTGQTLSVTRGAVLQVRVNDPKKLLAGRADLLLGVILPSSRFHPLRLASTDGAGQTYDTAIPTDTSVKVSITSAHVQLSDDQGKKLVPVTSGPASPTASAIISVRSPKGQGKTVLVLNVTGRK